MNPKYIACYDKRNNIGCYHEINEKCTCKCQDAINEMFDSISNKDKIERMASLWQEYVIDQNLFTNDLLKCRKALDIQFALDKVINKIQTELERYRKEETPNERSYSSTQVIALLKMILEDKEF